MEFDVHFQVIHHHYSAKSSVIKHLTAEREYFHTSSVVDHFIFKANQWTCTVQHI